MARETDEATFNRNNNANPKSTKSTWLASVRNEETLIMSDDEVMNFYLAFI